MTPDIIPAPLDPLSFFAKETLTDLPAQILEGEAERFRARLYGQFDFRFAATEGIRDVDHSRIFLESSSDFGRDHAQFIDVGPPPTGCRWACPPSSGPSGNPVRRRRESDRHALEAGCRFGYSKVDVCLQG